jgi:hypothetical protein
MKIMEMTGETSHEIDTTSFDISAKDARKFKIGDKVEIYISGIVGMVEVPPEDLGDKSDNTDSTLGIRILERSCKTVGQASEQELGIKELADDTDEPDEFVED